MKKFYDFSEALILSLKPTSDAVAPATQAIEKKPKDMFSTTADNYIKDVIGDEETVQPDDNVGEAGEIGSESSESNIDLECLGEEGLKIKFNGLEFVLPVDVVEAIKGFKSEGSTEEEHEEHEENESPEEEESEHNEGGSEENKTEEEDEEKKNPFSESEQIPIVYKVKRKSSTNEWVVAAYVNGKFDEDKSYFTDDKQDAIGTMKYMQEKDPFVKTPVTESTKILITYKLIFHPQDAYHRKHWSIVAYVNGKEDKDRSNYYILDKADATESLKYLRKFDSYVGADPFRDLGLPHHKTSVTESTKKKDTRSAYDIYDWGVEDTLSKNDPRKKSVNKLIKKEKTTKKSKK